VFVTVDPERDTVQSMHAYLSSFDKHIRGYTGTPAEIAQIAKEYRVYYQEPWKRLLDDLFGEHE
jgi:protein SCO1